MGYYYNFEYFHKLPTLETVLISVYFKEVSHALDKVISIGIHDFNSKYANRLKSNLCPFIKKTSLFPFHKLQLIFSLVVLTVSISVDTCFAYFPLRGSVCGIEKVVPIPTNMPPLLFIALPLKSLRVISQNWSTWTSSSFVKKYAYS